MGTDPQEYVICALWTANLQCASSRNFEFDIEPLKYIHETASVVRSKVSSMMNDYH